MRRLRRNSAYFSVLSRAYHRYLEERIEAVTHVKYMRAMSKLRSGFGSDLLHFERKRLKARYDLCDGELPFYWQNREPGQRLIERCEELGCEMTDKIKVEVQKTKRVFVHNDLSQAADYFAKTIAEKLEKGTRDAIMYDAMACAVMIAFTFEANVNFMGFKMNEAGRLPAWKERDPFMEKLNKVFAALGLTIDFTTRPLKSMERMKALRDTLAHGKPVYDNFKQVVIGTHEEIDEFMRVDLAAGWEKECMPAVIEEVGNDLDDLWKLMIEKSGLDIWDTMTSGDGGTTFIEKVDPTTPSTVPSSQ